MTREYLLFAARTVETRYERYPLLRHCHPLVIYRPQVIKQVDMVLAMFLLGHAFPNEAKHRNFTFMAR